ncbi:large-conductance mechanosensitive channel [Umbelopsis sp. PMI_123]|nr:large-conductance mechanosensitive channel [Umbelopsis sp. PMI_123]
MPRLEGAEQGLLGSHHIIKRHATSFWADFKDFLNRGNVISLAIGIIMGAQFNNIITSLTDDIIMPPVGLVTGNNFKNLFVIIRAGSTANATYDTFHQARDDGAVTFNYGNFIQTIINFFLVGFGLYWIVKVSQSFQRKTLKASSVKCPFCLSNVAKNAKKCPACTSWIDGRDGETTLPISPEESEENDDDA